MCPEHSRPSVASSCDILTTWETLSSVTLIVIQLIYIFYGMIYASGKYSPDYITSNHSGLSVSTLYDTQFTASGSSQRSSCQSSLNTTYGYLMPWAFLAGFLVVPLRGTLNTHVLVNNTAMPHRGIFSTLFCPCYSSAQNATYPCEYKKDTLFSLPVESLPML